MGVYVDEMEAEFRQMKMCHMIADSLEELHEMADKIGVKRKWFQPKSFPHYDVCKSKKILAVENGAKIISPDEFVQVMKRYREKVKNES